MSVKRSAVQRSSSGPDRPHDEQRDLPEGGIDASVGRDHPAAVGGEGDHALLARRPHASMGRREPCDERASLAGRRPPRGDVLVQAPRLEVPPVVDDRAQRVAPPVPHHDPASVAPDQHPVAREVDGVREAADVLVDPAPEDPRRQPLAVAQPAYADDP